MANDAALTALLAHHGISARAPQKWKQLAHALAKIAYPNITDFVQPRGGRKRKGIARRAIVRRFDKHFEAEKTRRPGLRKADAIRSFWKHADHRLFCEHRGTKTVKTLRKNLTRGRAEATQERERKATASKTLKHVRRRMMGAALIDPSYIGMGVRLQKAGTGST